MAGESSEDAFRRGHQQGSVETKLNEHSEHLAAINGSTADTAKGLHKLTVDLAEMNVKFTADLNTVIATAKAAAATVVATADALSASDEARRVADSEKKAKFWTPVTQLFAVLAAIEGIILIWATVFRH